MIKLLDTTLRDGSYVVNFKISQQQTYDIAKALDSQGIHYIEIGHGLGLNATNFPNMEADCSDEAYLEAASSAITNAVWGTFFIPGIGRISDIDTASKYGMSMIRIGANVNEYQKAEPFIKFAKEKSMFVCANFMKTYVMSFDEVSKVAEQAVNYGADLICIVDSAGAMLPSDVEGYIKAIRKSSNTKIGFHGHNNLGLGVSNAIVAVENGIDVVDVSLRGLGRSAGNTVFEIFVLTLKRMGIDLGFDIYKLLDISEKYIDPLLVGYKQVDSLSIISGYSMFHSSFQDKVSLIASEYGVDVRQVMVELCKIDKINAHDILVKSICSKLQKN